MKRLLLTLFVVLFASTSLAGATMGLYFDLLPGVMAYIPRRRPASSTSICISTIPTTT